MRLADELGHGPHRAVDAPAAGFKQGHGDQTKNCGGQHDAVKAKCKLGNPRMKQGSMVGPVPGQFKGPQECDYLFQASDVCENQISIPQHLEKHDKEKGQKSKAEPFAFHPHWNIFFP